MKIKILILLLVLLVLALASCNDRRTAMYKIQKIYPESEVAILPSSSNFIIRNPDGSIETVFFNGFGDITEKSQLNPIIIFPAK